MVPARLGSKRVPRKNLRLIEGKPLISYVIETLTHCTCFDEIYINSESDIFRKVAVNHGVEFYKRPPKHSTDRSTNDEFALDFIENVGGDILLQVLPTSPLITSEEITSFTEEMVCSDWDTLISVEYKQIACVYKNDPVNYKKLRVNPPSQQMVPVMAYATVMMGWKYNKFKNNMNIYGSAYHGGEGNTGYYELRGLSTIDIDREDDFQLVERIILSHKIQKTIKKGYYNG